MIQLLVFQLVCTESNLKEAWLKVKAKGAQGGIDGLGVADFARDEGHNLKALREELLENRYTPEPYKRIHIPKFDGTGEKRPLGLPAVRDKIVQEAVRAVIEPLFESEFLDSSYAYRSGKGSYKAIRRVIHYISQGYNWIARCDVDRFFDTLSHPVLLKLLSHKITDTAVMHLIKLWIKMGVVEGRGGWRDTLCGIPQGAVISPLLANVYLHPLDVEMASRDYAYIRYADDFCLLSRSKPETERAVAQAKRFLEQRLKLSLDECTITNTAHGFSFLGIHYYRGNLDIAQNKKGKFKEKLAYTFRAGKTVSLPQLVIKANEITTGWRQYYARLLKPPKQEYLRQLLLDNLALVVKEKLKNGELRNYKEARSGLEGLIWGEGAENQRFIKDIIAQARKLLTQEQACKLGLKDVSRAVAGKKRKYQRLQARECDLLVSTHGAFIGKRSRQVVVKCQGKLLRRVPEIALKQIIIISRDVSLSSDVIKHCTEKSIPIHFLTPDGKPYALIYSPLYPTLDLGLDQLNACRGAKGMDIAKRFVLGKLKNQVNLIKYCSKYRKGWDTDFAEMFDQFVKEMQGFCREVKAVDDHDPDTARGKLFSIEGRAASSYWKMFETVVNNKVEFAGRERRGASDLVNSMLNYGYGVLYPRIWLALSLAGLNLRLSFLHKEQPNKPTLVYDLIEEFRQGVVDRAIISLINRERELKLEGVLLSRKTRDKVAVAVLERLNTPLKFRGRNLSLAGIINHQARQLAACIKGEGAYKPFIAKW